METRPIRHMRKVIDRPGAAVILAVGYGSRMASLTATQPKCLLDVGGRSLIEAQVESLKRFACATSPSSSGIRATALENG
jgi:molybdopterin-guanine dinucleotide biosynthesis protein A